MAVTACARTMAASSLTPGVLDRRAAAGTFALLAVLGGLQAMPASDGVQRMSDVLQLLLAALASLAAVGAARRDRGKARLFWGMVATSTATWATGQLLFTVERSALSPVHPGLVRLRRVPARGGRAHPT